jgi:hypothetical protein
MVENHLSGRKVRFSSLPSRSKSGVLMSHLFLCFPCTRSEVCLLLVPSSLTWLSRVDEDPFFFCVILCRMGALMGGGVGLTIGFIFGSYSILRYAPFPPSLLISAVHRAHPTERKGVVPALAACLRPSRSTCSAARRLFRSSLPSDQCVLFLTHPPPSLTLSCHPPPLDFTSLHCNFVFIH